LEIGCGGTILKLTTGEIPLDVTWIVFSANEERRREATESADVFLGRAVKKEVLVNDYRDGFFPYIGGAIKEYFEALKTRMSPDLIFTHYRQDLHQDHRVISELTWNTFRNHFILEYEIPKYDGDMGSPNAFVQLDESTSRRKIETILASFQTQEHRHWFSEDLFLSLLRLRGMECNSPSGYAEAFYCRKMVL
jgi:LmbE family N-acetylglucosaminyl deacetylase